MYSCRALQSCQLSRLQVSCLFYSSRLRLKGIQQSQMGTQGLSAWLKQLGCPVHASAPASLCALELAPLWSLLGASSWNQPQHDAHPSSPALQLGIQADTGQAEQQLETTRVCYQPSSRY